MLKHTLVFLLGASVLVLVIGLNVTLSPPHKVSGGTPVSSVSLDVKSGDRRRQQRANSVRADVPRCLKRMSQLRGATHALHHAGTVATTGGTAIVQKTI